MLSKEHFLYQKVSLLSCQELFINCKTFYSWIAPFSEALPRWPPEILLILEKPVILDCSHPTDGQLFTQGGGMWRSFCSHTSPPSVRKYWIAICKFSTLGTTFFSACGGILRCRAQVDRQKHGKFPNSPRSPFFASSRNATLNEEHCVTKQNGCKDCESRFHYHWSGSIYNIIFLKIYKYIVLVKALFDVKKGLRDPVAHLNMVGMVTECNHPMHWRPDLFAFLRNGQAIIRRTINRSWGNFKVESVRDRFGINVPPFTGSRAGVFFPSKWWVWTIFKQARSARMVYRISMAFQQLCLLFAVVL